MTIRQIIRGLVAVLLAAPAVAAAQAPIGHLSNDGVIRATAQVDSVFLTRTKPDGRIDGGDWASYLLARLGAGRIPDSLGILVSVDTAHIEVQGRLQDLPPEARALLGPVARMVDSSTIVIADVLMQRTGREVLRFWLRGLRVNGFPFPEFLLGSMMASVGRKYPALTATGRDLYVQVPADARVSLGEGGVLLMVPTSAPTDSTGKPRTP